MATENQHRVNTDWEKLFNWVVKIAVVILMGWLTSITNSVSKVEEQNHSHESRLDVMDSYQFTEANALAMEKRINEKSDRDIEKLNDKIALILACLSRIQRNILCARGL